MNTSDVDIYYNDSGVCNHCIATEGLYENLPGSEDEEKDRLNLIVSKIHNRRKKNSDYDCLIGLSGGVDSSYVAYLTKKIGLHPLAVHFDNGWNSELSVHNIKNIVEKLDIDLVTYVIDWMEFRDLQRSFIKASVIDIEMLTDHAILASLFKVAKQYNIRYILSGTNIATESGMPGSWTWSKRDLRNIKAIHSQYGTGRLKNFPVLGKWKWLLIKYFGLGYEFVEILNEIRFRKSNAVKILEIELGWRNYGGKHYESIFTKFYQAYILPTKFNVDKRRAHLSSLIRNSEITREQALSQIAEPIYEPSELANDKEYVLKKLGFKESEFDSLMKLQPIAHDEYPSSEHLARKLKYIKSTLLRG